MWQLATDDIHWVNVVGMHWRGKAEVQKALLFKSRSCKLEEIESIEALPGGDGWIGHSIAIVRMG
jgi:hypothetical protein